METFVVICRDDWTGEQPGPYVLATRHVFRQWEDAQAYCRTINYSRQPLIISGRWRELRFDA